MVEWVLGIQMKEWNYRDHLSLVSNDKIQAKVQLYLNSTIYSENVTFIAISLARRCVTIPATGQGNIKACSNDSHLQLAKSKGKG